jgi:hypothetical protein
VLLIAHPSDSGISSGEGGGFSTAWNNSVRSRLYLRRPQTDDKEAAADRRILEVKKANYGPSGITIPLIYHAGAFVPDAEPIEEGPKFTRAPKLDTRLGLAIMDYFRAKAPTGSVVAFGPLFEAMQAAGDIPEGPYETVRKPLQRTLRDLERGGLINACKVPRGYRIAGTSRDTRDNSGDKLGTPGTLGTRDNRDTPKGGVSPASRADVPSSGKGPAMESRS